MLVLFAREGAKDQVARGRLDCHSHGIRDADHSWHSHRALGHRDLARGASPGDWGLLVAATVWGAHELGRRRAQHEQSVSVYAVFADASEAERIGRTVVEERLAACINILGPIRSIYRWQGAIESADEVAAIFKTNESRWGALITRIAGLHSYDVPCIVVWPIEKVAGAYAEWVEDSVG